MILNPNELLPFIVAHSLWLEMSSGQIFEPIELSRYQKTFYRIEPLYVSFVWSLIWINRWAFEDKLT